MILHIPSDGSGEQALAQLVAQHRAAFFAGVEIETEPEELDPPEAASACSHFLGDDSQRVEPAMGMLAGCIVSLVAIVGAAVLAIAV